MNPIIATTGRDPTEILAAPSSSASRLRIGVASAAGPVVWEFQPSDAAFFFHFVC